MHQLRLVLFSWQERKTDSFPSSATPRHQGGVWQNGGAIELKYQLLSYVSSIVKVVLVMEPLLIMPVNCNPKRNI